MYTFIYTYTCIHTHWNIRNVSILARALPPNSLSPSFSLELFLYRHSKPIYSSLIFFWVYIPLHDNMGQGRGSVIPLTSSDFHVFFYFFSLFCLFIHFFSYFYFIYLHFMYYYYTHKRKSHLHKYTIYMAWIEAFWLNDYCIFFFFSYADFSFSSFFFFENK